MEFSRVSLEAHRWSCTLYVAGLLADSAAGSVVELIRGLDHATLVIRVDLRGVVLIDPSAFVRIARDLNAWRDRGRGRRVFIQFPERSEHRHRAHLRLVDQPSTIARAVSTAMS